MKLKDLLKNAGVLELLGDPELEIDSVCYDSRQARPGCLFVAISGFASDGNRFIPMAVEKGAVAVVTAKKPEQPVPYVLVENDRRALAYIGINFFGSPAASMTMIGVTGTNGKTSTTLLVKQILERCLGAKVGLIGTMENLIGEEVVPTERTTPESFALQELFARMRDAGCTHVVMEVSSHAIALERVAGIRFDIGAFTNLTEDHLDFHKTMEAYRDTKAELFARCRRAVINVDDPNAGAMLARAECPVLRTSLTSGDLIARDLSFHGEGVEFTAALREKTVPVRLPIPGKFSVYNALTAIGIGLELGISLEDCAEALAQARGVRGRVEVVPTPGMPYSVLIDYAHTPDGLENVITAVKNFCRGRVITVFGCGGDRDPMKRPIMGEIGVKNSDIAIITSDNPRTENPGKIIQDILAGVKPEFGTYKVVENRRAAIRYAMDIGKKDDIIILAGKGHETYQEIHGVKHHLDEREEVAAYLSELRNQNG